MADIIYIDELAAMLDDIRLRHKEGEVKAIYALVQNTDGTFIIEQAGEAYNIFEAVGALEALKMSIWLQQEG